MVFAIPEIVHGCGLAVTVTLLNDAATEAACAGDGDTSEPANTQTDTASAAIALRTQPWPRRDASLPEDLDKRFPPAN